MRTRGKRIRGGALTAAGVLSTDFPILDQFLLGSAIAAGTTIAPGGPENFFPVTGGGSVSFVATANLIAGRDVEFRFVANTTLVHAAASPPAGTVPFLLAGSANYTVVPGIVNILRFRYDATLGAMIQVGPSGASAPIPGPGIGVAGNTVTAKVIGSLQLGGFIQGGLGSTICWFDQGFVAVASTIPIEFPIERFIAAGATRFDWDFFVGSWSSGAATAQISLSMNGSIITGTSQTLGVANVGGGGHSGPFSIGGGTLRRIGKTILPAGSTGGVQIISVLTFS